MQRGLRLPSTTNCLGPPPQMIVPYPSNFYILSASPLHLCVFVVCMFFKNQLNQSEEEIYCHILLITLLVCRLSFILLTHRISIKKIPSTLLYSFYVVVFSEELLYYKFCHHGRSKSKRGSEPPILSK